MHTNKSYVCVRNRIASHRTASHLAFKNIALFYVRFRRGVPLVRFFGGGTGDRGAAPDGYRRNYRFLRPP